MGIDSRIPVDCDFFPDNRIGAYPDARVQSSLGMDCGRGMDKYLIFAHSVPQDS
ncbi:hypothetical protein ES703_39231 [subsurface metagenome]